MKNLLVIIFVVVIDLYGADYCSYCRKASKLLDSRGLKYIKHDITKSQKIKEEVFKKSGGRTTIPQIFINNKHIGGYDDLVKLDNSGELDKMVK